MNRVEQKEERVQQLVVGTNLAVLETIRRERLEHSEWRGKQGKVKFGEVDVGTSDSNQGGVEPLKAISAVVVKNWTKCKEANT